MGAIDTEFEARAIGEERGVDRLTDAVTVADAFELAACVPRPPAERSSCGFAPTE